MDDDEWGIDLFVFVLRLHQHQLQMEHLVSSKKKKKLQGQKDRQINERKGKKPTKLISSKSKSMTNVK